MTDGDGHWHRLHPLSPVVRAGRALIAVAILLLPSLAGGRSLVGAAVEVAIVGLLALAGAVTWLVTRWRLEGDALRIETGLLKRSSLRFPLAQVQAIDVVRPGVARLFGLAELRLRMGGSTGAHGRLAYLREHHAEELRARLLAIAHGAGEEQTQAVHERVLLSVPTPRLLGSIVLSRTGLHAELLLAGLVAGAVLAPGTARAAVGGSGVLYAVGAATVLWRRFNDEYRLTVAEAPDGLRLRSGFVSLTSETIPRGRVQAVRMVEPLFWRPFGWCRLEVDIAGKQRKEGEGAAEARQLRAVLPVGSRRLAAALLERILPDAPAERLPPPRRVLWKSPLRRQYLAWGHTESCVVTASGRVARVTAWVPLEKVQSLRRVQGPVQRRLRLATIHVDTAGRSVHAALRDRDVAEADAALEELIRLARAARTGGARPAA
ncbi:MAG TPA: PH domain-containing protein [Gaiellaceae bacterium]